eukprot:265717_1
MFFAIHLFREQIFSMSEHLERILNQFLKVNRYEVCDEDVMEEYKDQDEEDWPTQSEGCLPFQLCGLGARHRDIVELYQPRTEQEQQDMARFKRIIQLLWNKFQTFALEPNESQRIKFDKTSSTDWPAKIKERNSWSCNTRIQ